MAKINERLIFRAVRISWISAAVTSGAQAWPAPWGCHLPALPAAEEQPCEVFGGSGIQDKSNSLPKGKATLSGFRASLQCRGQTLSRELARLGTLGRTGKWVSQLPGISCIPNHGEQHQKGTVCL